MRKESIVQVLCLRSNAPVWTGLERADQKHCVLPKARIKCLKLKNPEIEENHHKQGRYPSEVVMQSKSPYSPESSVHASLQYKLCSNDMNGPSFVSLFVIFVSSVIMQKQE